MPARRAKGEGSVIRRPDGSYAHVFDLGKDPKTGKRRRRWVVGKTRADVVRKVSDLRARGGGTMRPRVAGTVGEWMARWLAETKASLNPNSFVGYEGAWRLHASPILASQTMERFDVEDVEALFAGLRARGISASVVNRVATVMHRAFEVAIRRRAYMKANPFALVERPRVSRSDTKTLEPSEAKRFLEAARGDRYEALWVLLLTSGLRLGEALALEWGDVDFRERTVSVHRSFLEVSGRIEIGTTKNRTSRRLVAIGERTIGALLERRRSAKSEALDTRLIFPTTVGTPTRRSNLRRSHFAPIIAKAKLSGLRIHDLRHSMTSLALVQGIPAKVLAERLGHSTTRLTLDRYSHLIGDLQGLAADAIESAIAKPSNRRNPRR